MSLASRSRSSLAACFATSSRAWRSSHISFICTRKPDIVMPTNTTGISASSMSEMVVVAEPGDEQVAGGHAEHGPHRPLPVGHRPADGGRYVDPHHAAAHVRAAEHQVEGGGEREQQPEIPPGQRWALVPLGDHDDEHQRRTRRRRRLPWLATPRCGRCRTGWTAAAPGRSARWRRTAGAATASPAAGCDRDPCSAGFDQQSRSRCHPPSVPCDGFLIRQSPPSSAPRASRARRRPPARRTGRGSGSRAPTRCR